MMFPGISIGLSKTITHPVDHRDTAGNCLPEDIEPLLSSSGLINLTINTAVELVDPLLPERFLSIGKSSSLSHEHPSELGAHLSLIVTIAEFHGYHITLRIVASDETGVVCHGSHVRSIVNKHWLRISVADRVAGTA